MFRPCVTQREPPQELYDYCKIKYNKAWLNTNVAKTPTEKHIASVHGNFCLHLHSYASLAKTWLSIRNRISPGVTTYLGSECSFVFFLNRLTANERASISRAVLEMEANAVLYLGLVGTLSRVIKVYQECI